MNSCLSWTLNKIIYACQPWSEESPAIVIPIPSEDATDDGELPPEAEEVGAEYFLEVFIAQEVAEGFIQNSPSAVSVGDLCKRIIYYATYDA